MFRNDSRFIYDSISQDILSQIFMLSNQMSHCTHLCKKIRVNIVLICFFLSLYDQNIQF